MERKTEADIQATLVQRTVVAIELQRLVNKLVAPCERCGLLLTTFRWNTERLMHLCGNRDCSNRDKPVPGLALTELHDIQRLAQMLAGEKV